MSNWKYYDQTKDKIFDLPAFKLESEDTGYSYQMNGMPYVKSPDRFVISIDSTKFDSDYVSNMLNEVYGLSGRYMQREDYVRNLVLLNEEGRAIELMGCVVKNSTMSINGICEQIEFSVDKHVESFDDDRYYEIIREIRQKKIDNLLK